MLIGVGEDPGDKKADAAHQQNACNQDLHRLVAGSVIDHGWAGLPLCRYRGCFRVSHGSKPCLLL